MTLITITFSIIFCILLLRLFQYTKLIKEIFFLFFSTLIISIISLKIIEIIFGKPVDFILAGIFSRGIMISIFFIIFIIYLFISKESKKVKCLYGFYFLIDICFIVLSSISVYYSDFNGLIYDSYIDFYNDFSFYLYYIISFYFLHYFILGNKNFISISVGENIFYVFRDITLIVFFYILFTFTLYLGNLFTTYKDWKNVNYYDISKIYSCKDDKNIVLESSDDRIIPVNPYENFIDFFNNYRNDFRNFSDFDHHMYYTSESKKYLKNCISENEDNYFDEYKKYHGDFKMKIDIFHKF